MILKKFKRTNLARTKRAMIGGLFDYVLAENDEAGKDKCVWSSTLNFIAATRKGQKAEMVCLAEESIKSRMPVAHWMLSWNENEIPTEAQVTEAVQMFLQGMELEGIRHSWQSMPIPKMFMLIFWSIVFILIACKSFSLTSALTLKRPIR